MSRTDIHVPYWVRLLEDHAELHFHQNKDCDILPIKDHVKKLKKGVLFSYRSCQYMIPKESLIKRPLCGCWLCHGKPETSAKSTIKYKKIKEQLEDLDCEF